MMLYALMTVPAFAAFCFLIGLPLTRVLLKAAPRSSQLYLAPTFGFGLLATFIEPTIKLLGAISHWWWAIWLAALISMIALGSLKALECRTLRRSGSGLPDLGSSRIVAALGIASIFAALLALPLVGDVSYIIFRSNPSDANVNITMADAWINAPWSQISAYSNSIGTANQAPETIRIVADAPISIFSARFIGTEVRLATSMLIGLYSELFRLPPYLAYFPFMLATAGIAAFTAFGMMRSMGSRTWFALIIAASVIGGWDYIVRESDNNNQHATLPFLIATLYLVYLRFDAGWKSPLKSSFAIALMFAAGITPYPEIGGALALSVLGALVFSGLVRRSDRSHWITTGVTLVALLGILAVNGQLWILAKWIGLVQSDTLSLGSFTGPTGDYIERWGVVGVAGLPRMPVANVLLPYFAWGLLAAVAGIILFWGWRSTIGLSVLAYAAGLCAIAAYGVYVSGVPYIAYRAASFAGFVAFIACGATLMAGSTKAAGEPIWGLRSMPRAGSMLLLSIGVAASMQFWAGAFTQGARGFTMMTHRDVKQNVPNLTLIRDSLASNKNGKLAIYIPPMSGGQIPWYSSLHAYLTAAPYDPVFLSGLMHDNKDVRMPIRKQMYASAEQLAQQISLLLVDVVHDPVPLRVNGKLLASEPPFRLYQIDPTPVSELMDRLPEREK